MPTSLSPLTGGGAPFVAGTFFDLATVGYEQAEYALTTPVRAYAPGPSGPEVVEEDEVTTRLLVHRPVDPAAFSGTVVVEWLNVSGGLDAAPLWLFTHRELVRRGTAWVGVSAQRVGVHGGEGVLGMPTSALVDLDPARYGGLSVPGDRYSYDVFTAAGRAARTGAGTVLEGLPIERVLGVGESQSAFRLTTYVNELDPLEAAFDGFLVHARGGTAAPFDDEDGGGRQLRAGPAVPFREDLRAPVVCVEAETDLVTLGYRDARQDDGPHLVTWELAGCSHADAYTFGAGFFDDGLQPIADLARAWRPTRELFGQQLDEAVNVGPQHYVVQAALRALDTWAAGGARPPAAPRLQLEGYGFATDELGNALGGVRTPHVDVPVATLSGLGNGGSPLAFLAGSTKPFSHARLVELYGTRAGYLERFRASAESAVAAGHLLAEDLDEVVGIAEANVDL